MSQIVDCSEFCRLCLVKEQVNTPIFEEDGGYHQLSTKISTCLPVKVSREDSLPKRICDGCCYKVEQQYQFWNISLNAEKQFKQWLGISEDTETAKQNVNKIKKESTYDGPSASKRPKRNARRKAVQNIRQATAAQQSDSDSDIPLAARTVAPSIEVEPIAKDENDSDHHDFPEDNDSMDPPNFVNMNLEGEQDQAGPSGLQKAESTEPVEAAPATLNMEIEAGEGTIVKSVQTRKEGRKKKEIGDDSINLNETATSFHCETCNGTFKTHSNLKRHEKKHIESQLQYPCDVCGKYFPELCILKSHTVMHTLERPFICDVCNKAFKRKGELKKHKTTHAATKQHSCLQCNYRTTFKSNLELHIKRLHSKGNQFSCPDCPKKYYTKIDYERHVAIHAEIKKYSCDICGKSYPYHSSFLIHRRKHDPDYIQKTYTCEFCGYSTLRPTYLRYHIQTRHLGYFEICDICGKQVSAPYLARHKQLHSEIKPFKCSVCGKSFVKNTYLVNHERIHTGVKPFQCKECGQCFAQKITLLKHEERHSKHTTYVCTVCSKTFVMKKHLKMHLKTHKPVS